jgi:hypothetical protein
MEQLTLEQAANKFAPSIEGNGFVECFNKLINETKQFGFKAGAEWQKEQYTRILQLAFNAANELDSLGAAFLCGEIKTELERLLQD